jgi:DNA invertase Pin-like site-specific DNA recombinase
MLIGYARISTADQNLDLQIDALRAAGCEHICEDRLSGTLRSRPGLDKAIASLAAGDVLTVWKLDRLGRSLSHLVGLVDELGKRGIGFRSLTESIDTTSAGGRLLLHVMAALAEFERSIIVERTQAGIKAAKNRGTHCGRPSALSADQLRHARLALDAGEPARKVARLFNIGESTRYRHLQRQG